MRGDDYPQLPASSTLTHTHRHTALHYRVCYSYTLININEVITSWRPPRWSYRPNLDQLKLHLHSRCGISYHIDHRSTTTRLQLKIHALAAIWSACVVVVEKLRCNGDMAQISCMSRGAPQRSLTCMGRATGVAPCKLPHGEGSIEESGAARRDGEGSSLAGEAWSEEASAGERQCRRGSVGRAETGKWGSEQPQRPSGSCCTALDPKFPTVTPFLPLTWHSSALARGRPSHHRFFTFKVGAPISVSIPIAVISTPFLDFRCEYRSRIHALFQGTNVVPKYMPNN